jgi:hypothetical protein
MWNEGSVATVPTVCDRQKNHEENPVRAAMTSDVRARYLRIKVKVYHEDTWESGGIAHHS